MKPMHQFKTNLIFILAMMSTSALAKKHDFSFALKPGFLSAGIEAAYDLGPAFLVLGQDVDIYLVGGYATSYLGAKKYFSDSFFTRLSASYVEDSGKYLYGAGPGLSFTIGNTWEASIFGDTRVIYGGEWIGTTLYYNNIEHKLKYFLHFPKIYFGFIF